MTEWMVWRWCKNEERVTNAIQNKIHRTIKTWNVCRGRERGEGKISLERMWITIRTVPVRNIQIFTIYVSTKRSNYAEKGILIFVWTRWFSKRWWQRTEVESKGDGTLQSGVRIPRHAFHFNKRVCHHSNAVYTCVFVYTTNTHSYKYLIPYTNRTFHMYIEHRQEGQIRFSVQHHSHLQSHLNVFAFECQIKLD